jgi:hypothetical protein
MPYSYADAEHLFESQQDLLLLVKPVLLLDPAHHLMLIEIPERVQTAGGGV